MHVPATLTVTFEKRADGDTVLRCTRADGSATSQRHGGPRSVFFAYHDLTHLAVERTLRFTQGFFGLIASGWDIDDTEGKGRRGPLPPQSIEIENLVGLFDRERASSGATWSAEEFNAAAATYAMSRGERAPAPLDDDTIARVRNEVTALHDAWRATEPGGVLRVEFGG